MYITSVRLENFGPFEDSGQIELEPGMNLIVGQNNAGKSALLRALKSPFENMPHRNGQRFYPEDLHQPWLKVGIVASGQEMRTAFLENGGDLAWPKYAAAGAGLDQDAQAAEALSTVFDAGKHEFEVMRGPNAAFQATNGASHKDFGEPGDTSYLFSAYRPNILYRGTSNGDTIPSVLTRLWTSNVFVFDAERLRVGRCPQHDADMLTSNAGNLPAVLQRMRGSRPGLYERLVALVRAVIPSIFYVSTLAVGSETEILLFPENRLDHSEHGFPLNDSGSGVAQVLAILTAALTMKQAVIAVDEINSFLHPAAVKALISILQTEFSRHQYLISTHSAEVISASMPRTLHLVSREGFRSNVRSLDLENIESLKGLSSHLGISIGDVFAADHVIWVEGRTEELVFPFLMKEMGLKVPPGVIVSSLVATGDFLSAKGPDLIFKIYEKITSTTLPLVKSVTFSFDGEDYTKEQRLNLSKRGRGRVYFLPRRNLECFFLEPEVIAAYLKEYDLNGPAIAVATVETALVSLGGEKRFKAAERWTGGFRDPKWLAEVDGAKLLAEMVGQLTEHRVEFRKTDHALSLMRHTLSLKPEVLEPLREYMSALIAAVETEMPK